jgi:hypothetical protein
MIPFEQALSLNGIMKSQSTIKYSYNNNTPIRKTQAEGNLQIWLRDDKSHALSSTNHIGYKVLGFSL